jgi:hypothetical protein
MMRFSISISCTCLGLIPSDIASLAIVYRIKYSLVKQVLHLGQLATMGASALYLNLLILKGLRGSPNSLNYQKVL